MNIGEIEFNSWQGDLHLPQIILKDVTAPGWSTGSVYAWNQLRSRQSYVQTITITDVAGANSARNLAYQYIGTIQTATLDGTLGDQQEYKVTVLSANVTVKKIVPTTQYQPPSSDPSNPDPPPAIDEDCMVVVDWALDVYQVEGGD